MSLIETAVGLATMNALGIALLVGSVFILPLLIYLIYGFQRRPIEVMGGSDYWKWSKFKIRIINQFLFLNFGQEAVSLYYKRMI